ncbi:voltage-dependent anion channel [Poronia punctata]|nr:voltage-dependent anion channel [Poronia punctata]
MPDRSSQTDGYRVISHKVGFRERIAHFTWANFACTQSTGSVAILLSSTRRQFHGMQTAAVVLFVLDMVLFVLFCGAMITRFSLHPHMLVRSFTRPPEPFYFSTFMVSIDACIICMQRFGVAHVGPWLVYAIRVLFWFYAGASLLFATVIWLIIGAKSPFKAIQLHPAVFLMIINTMLTSVIASNIVESQPSEQGMLMIVAAVAYVGLGLIVTVMLLAWHLASIVELGLGDPSQRLGMFMPVGASGYAMVALIGCSRHLPTDYGYFAKNPAAADTVRVMALWTSVFLWLFTFWVFSLALLASLPAIWSSRSRSGMHFTLAWWGAVFPNAGFVLATEFIGNELESDAVEWVAVGMTAVLFATWLLNLVLHGKAIVTRQIVWPGKDEDVGEDEGMFKSK